jgi:hypothetical protein
MQKQTNLAVDYGYEIIDIDIAIDRNRNTQNRCEWVDMVKLRAVNIVG